MNELQTENYVRQKVNNFLKLICYCVNKSYDSWEFGQTIFFYVKYVGIPCHAADS